jgi:uncharacterized membrane protein
MILQRSALSEQDVAVLFQAGRTAGMQPLFLPGAYEDLLRGLTTDEITLDQFLVQKDYNLFPTTDDSPFFFNLNPGLPQPLQILLIAAGVVLLLYLLLMGGARNRPSVSQLLFFGGLGLGYILIEVPLIQRTLLSVGNPTLALVVVLAALLLSGAVGSMFSARWGIEKPWKHIAVSALVVAVLSLGLAYGQPPLVAGLSKLSFALRLLISILLLIPLGFVMGIPFSNGYGWLGHPMKPLCLIYGAGMRSLRSQVLRWHESCHLGWFRMGMLAGQSVI